MDQVPTTRCAVARVIDESNVCSGAEGQTNRADAEDDLEKARQAADGSFPAKQAGHALISGVGGRIRARSKTVVKRFPVARRRLRGIDPCASMVDDTQRQLHPVWLINVQ